MNPVSQAQYDRICSIEDKANRALQAISQFTDAPVSKQLKDAQFIISAVRASAFHLVNPDTPDDVRQEVINGLVEIIKNL